MFNAINKDADNDKIPDLSDEKVVEIMDIKQLIALADSLSINVSKPKFGKYKAP
jgi:hypothetical protein